MPCSVLIFDSQHSSHSNSKKSLLPLARNALRRLRTTRHPDVIRLLNSAETPSGVFIAVEHIRPLGKVLAEMSNHGASGSGNNYGKERSTATTTTTQTQKDEWVGWGLSKVTNALRFMHSDMHVSHGNVRIDSIFLAPSGEWRLGGLELVSDQATSNDFIGSSEVTSLLYTMGGMVPDAIRNAPPEVKQAGWSVLKELDIHAFDSYAFGRMIIEAYNGTLAPSSSNANAIPAQGRVPTPLFTLVKRMLLPNAKSRLRIETFEEAGNKVPGGFFAENRLVKVANGLDGFILSSEEDRAQILKTIKQSSQSFPPEFLQHKVLPVLVNAMTLAGGSSSTSTNNVGNSDGERITNVPASLHASRLLPLIVQLGQPLNDDDWKRAVAPTIFQTFQSADRSIRMALLDNLTMFIQKLDNKQISDRIWPQLLSGFVDTSAVIREATVRAIVPLSDKLSERILNNDLLRQLARTQVDSEAQIRTNTTILLGNLAPKLSLSTRKKVLIPAFIRVLKDTFVPARIAGIMAFMATAESFDGTESANQILPAICPCLLDGDQGVREQAKSALDLFLKKTEEAAKRLGSSQDHSQQENKEAISSSLMPNVTVQSTTSAATALAQWTVARFGGGIENAEKESQINKVETNSNLQIAANGKLQPISNQTASLSSSRQGSQTRLNTTAAAFDIDSLHNSQNETDDAMSLGMMEDEPEDEIAKAEAPQNVSWSQNGDLMNVMDDEDDWTNFTAAPSNGALHRKTQDVKNRNTIANTTTARNSPQAKSRLGTVKRMQSPSTTSSSSGNVKNTSNGSRHALPVPTVPLNDEEEDAWDI
jgi:SCY1-like protein 1